MRGNAPGTNVPKSHSSSRSLHRLHLGHLRSHLTFLTLQFLQLFSVVRVPTAAASALTLARCAPPPDPAAATVADPLALALDVRVWPFPRPCPAAPTPRKLPPPASTSPPYDVRRRVVPVGGGSKAAVLSAVNGLSGSSPKAGPPTCCPGGKAVCTSWSGSRDVRSKGATSCAPGAGGGKGCANDPKAVDGARSAGEMWARGRDDGRGWRNGV